MALNRRTFVKTAALAASAVGLPAASYARVIGSNDGIRVGVIGTRGRGQNHMSGLRKQLKALCDVDENILNERAKGKDVEKYVDFRELLNNKNIDAVSIATPNHTHSLIGIEAMKAGKDVYVEKPVSHNVWEGRQLAMAARKYDRICQCGTQSRSSPSLQKAVKYVQSGKLGKILYGIGTCYKPRKSIGLLEKPLKIGKHVNYDLWCGPAEKRSLYRPQLHYDWHWDFNTGNGDMGNQGIHQMDIARWFMGYDELSPRVLSIGGRVGYQDGGDTPNTQTVIHDYKPAPLIFETRGLPKAKEFQDKRWGGSMDNYRGSRIGVIIQCENGYVVIPSYTNAKAFDKDGKELMKWGGGGNHYRNFVEAVEKRDRKILNGEVMEGHLSSALCHTGGVSHQLGKPANFDEIAEKIGDNELFMDSFKRMASHLEKNGVNIKNGKGITLGAELIMDGKKETVLNNEKANSMMSREYRKGFEVSSVS